MDLFNNARTAYEAFIENKYDIVYLDIKLENSNGLEFIKVFKKRRPEVAFFIVSEMPNFSHALEAIKLGVSHYIQKPIIEKEFILALNNLMDKDSRNLSKKKSQLDNREYSREIIIPLLTGSEDQKIKTLCKAQDFDLYGISFYIIPISDFNSFEDKKVKDDSLSIHLELSEHILYIFLFTSKQNVLQNHIDYITTSDFSLSMMDAIEYYFLDLKRTLKIESIHDVRRIALYFLTQDFNFESNSHLLKEYITLQLLQYNSEDILKYLVNLQDAFIIECTKCGIYTPNELVKLRNLSFSMRNKFLEISMILDYLIQAYSEYASVLNKNLNHQIILRSKKYLMENYNKNITLDDLAHFLHLSSSHVSKVLRKDNTSFSDLLNQIRINKAKSLLESDVNMNITQKTFASGYHSSNYSARVFKKYVGLTLTKYQQLMWNKK